MIPLYSYSKKNVGLTAEHLCIHPLESDEYSLRCYINLCPIHAIDFSHDSIMPLFIYLFLSLFGLRIVGISFTARVQELLSLYCQP